MFGVTVVSPRLSCHGPEPMHVCASNSSGRAGIPNVFEVLSAREKPAFCAGIVAHSPYGISRRPYFENHIDVFTEFLVGRRSVGLDLQSQLRVSSSATPE